MLDQAVVEEAERALVVLQHGCKCAGCATYLQPGHAECPECDWTTCPYCGSSLTEGEFCKHLIALRGWEGGWCGDGAIDVKLPECLHEDDLYALEERIAKLDPTDREASFGPLSGIEEPFIDGPYGAEYSPDVLLALCDQAEVPMLVAGVNVGDISEWYAYLSSLGQDEAARRLEPLITPLNRALLSLLKEAGDA